MVGALEDELTVVVVDAFVVIVPFSVAGSLPSFADVVVETLG